ncbi:hypothetical protein RO3G_07908 [Rhizopus delemar RA 99-880]|uniref:Uncharacterized protein n=1 Tax=Rhizopus delemar (strain RA 99-880 / ATCC MYA-4621 / FGSC 9543 / NRRL 43880) TaxID=246409 RepID=I1C423_RHIO9|nr:hypothetical protein RO3G_07908 [Rhizopus delemar RA 99-880]|eukprot:EIE83203.1 hypothetical protein RO3G_07908 [Rhizopus delemar RA 99-880]
MLPHVVISLKNANNREQVERCYQTMYGKKKKPFTQPKKNLQYTHLLMSNSVHPKNYYQQLMMAKMSNCHLEKILIS